MNQPIEKTATPQRKKRGALLVHERLREEILWLRLEPGSALDEVALAKKYEVSRTPIREALLLLGTEGFVDFLPNRTTVVAPMSMHNQAAFLDTFILLSRGLIRSVTMNGLAREAHLQPFVAGYAKALEADDFEAAFRVQLSFFRHIAVLAQNRFLEKYFLEAQDASVRMKLLYFFPHLSDADKIEACARLEAVVASVLSGNPETSDKAICASIQFETGVIQRGLEPRFGHKLDLGAENSSTGEVV